MADEPQVPVGTLAILFDCTEKHIQRLESSGILVKAARGKYFVWQSITNYVKLLRDKKNGGEGGGEATDIDKWKAELVKENATIAKIKRQTMEGESMPGDLVTDYVGDMISRVRSRVLAIPPGCAPRVADIMDAAIVEDVLREAVELALNEFASFDAGDIVDRYVRRAVEAVETAAEADAEPVERPDPSPKQRGKRRTRKVADKPS